MNKTLFFYFMIFLSIILSGCYGKQKTCISKEELTLSPKPLVIDLSTPLQRKKESGGVQLNLVGNWRWQDWDKNKIVFDDRTIAEIKVILVDDKGNNYCQGGQTHSGIFYEACFGDLGESLKITKIIITSTSQIKCKEIVWYFFDPI